MLARGPALPHRDDGSGGDSHATLANVSAAVMPMTMTEAEIKDQEWLRLNENPLIKALDSGAPIAEALSAEQIRQASGPSSRLTCCDPRIPSAASGKIAVAGSLLMAGEADVDRFLETYGAGIREVTSHDGCSAAVLTYEAMERAGKLPEGVGSPVELAMHFAQGIARRLGASYHHYPFEELNFPLNTARAIWVDLCGDFRPDLIGKMPPHFFCSAAAYGFEDTYVINEVATLASFALGDPGFGGRFDSNHPLYVLLHAPDEARLAQLLDALRAKFGENPAISVQGLLQPAKE